MSFQSMDKGTNEETQKSGRPSQGDGESLTPISPVVDKSKQKAEDTYKLLRAQVGQRVRSFFAQQMGRTAEELNSFAHAFRQTGDKLREQDHDTFAAYANSLADRVERFSGGLRHNDMESAIRKTKNLARENPLIFMGGAFALGVIFAHFLKGSGSEGIPESAKEYEFDNYDEEVTSYERH